MKTSKRLALLAVMVLLAAGAAQAGLAFNAKASGAQSVSAIEPGLIENAMVRVEFDDAFTQAFVRLVIEGGDNVVAAHFHCARPGENGPVAFGIFQPGPLEFDGRQASGVLTNADFTGADCNGTIGRPVSNIVSLAMAMRAGQIYLNIHTTDNPPGEARGQMLEGKNRRGDGDDDDDDDHHAAHHGHDGQRNFQFTFTEDTEVGGVARP